MKYQKFSEAWTHVVNGYWPSVKEVVTDVLGLTDESSTHGGKKVWITGHSQGAWRGDMASMWLRKKFPNINQVLFIFM